MHIRFPAAKNSYPPLAQDIGKTTVKVTNKPILLVEDDLVDAMTVVRALKEIRAGTGNLNKPLSGRSATFDGP